MTPSEIELAARQRYNAEDETFWGSSEIMGLIYAACEELATETLCIERSYSASTVSGVQEYDYPTGTISIKRVTWGGKKLQPITFREDDQVTGYNQASTTTGDPEYYSEWNGTLILRPIPDSVATLKVYSINEPQPVTITSVLEVPTWTHSRLINYIVSEMAAKDENYIKAKRYGDRWELDKLEVKQWMKRKKRSDSFAHTLDEATTARTILGLA